MVAIIDDREDVWNFSPNLIHVRPYQFFYGTADINVPPGLGDMPSEQPKNDMTRESRIVRVPKKKNKSDNTKKEETDEKKDLENGSEKDKVVEEKENEKEQELPSGEERIASKAYDAKSETTDSKPSEVKSPKLIDTEVKGEEKEEGDKSEYNVLKESEPPPCEDVTEISKEVNSGGSAKEEGECESLSDDSAKDEKKKCKEKKPKDADVDSGSDEDGTEYDEMIEWVDPDDYLLYLQDILQRIHQAFYELYDQTKDRENQELPSLKKIIPYVKRKTLQGSRILFSGLPTNRPLEQSRKYHLAQTLGAHVQTDFIAPDAKNGNFATTHVVASRPGTQKVRTASKYKSINVVNHDWLFACADRWERVDEELFSHITEPGPEQLRQDLIMFPRAKRKCEEDHVSSEDGVPAGKEPKAQRRAGGDEFGDGLDRLETCDPNIRETAKDGKEPTPSTSYGEPASLTERRFSDSYNPMLAFSKDDIDDMDKEVEDILDSSDSENEESEDVADKKLRQKVLNAKNRNSSSEESLGGNFPRGWKKKLHKKRYRKEKEERQQGEDEDGEDDDVDKEGLDDGEAPDQPHRIMRHSSDSDSSDPNSDKESFDESIGSVDEEMAAAVEKELLNF